MVIGKLVYNRQKMKSELREIFHEFSYQIALENFYRILLKEPTKPYLYTPMKIEDDVTYEFRYLVLHSEEYGLNAIMWLS